jgi:uncharacterized protein YbgA (DUF1722 family)/uncharacterized protein YbbK (DUF523 family)
VTQKDNPVIRPIRVGVSTCLLGEKVRFDSGHKRDRFITDVLSQYVEFVPVCPEVDVGMGIPREPVRLTGDQSAPRMVGVRSGEDWTDRMNTYARQRARGLAGETLSGYILKKSSPSCGMERVKVYGEARPAGRHGVGLFAAALMKRMPLLPVEEEGRLNDLRLRENFIERVFAYHRLQSLFGGHTSRKAVIDFHTVHKYLIMAHSPKHYKQLGQLVAAVADYTPGEFRDQYNVLFMEAMGVKTTASKHTNVLHHMMGYLKTHLAADEKQYLLEVIADYRNSLIPLIVPITLIRQYILKFKVTYIADQYYLNPHPKEMMLRNHV